MISSLSGKLLSRAGNEGKLVYGPKGLDLREPVRINLLRNSSGFVLQGRSLDDFEQSVSDGFSIADLRYITRACYRATKGSLAGPGQYVESPDQSATNQILCNNLLITDLGGKGFDILTSVLQKAVYRFFSKYDKEKKEDFALYVTQPKRVRIGQQKKISARNQWQAQILRMPDIHSTDSFYNSLGRLIGLYAGGSTTEEESKKFVAFLSQLLGFEEQVLSKKDKSFPFLGTRVTKRGTGPLYNVSIEPAVSKVDQENPIIYGIRIEAELSGDYVAYVREPINFIGRLERLTA
jgi:hypothetical protein